jgi:hypothetical protein
MRPLVKVKIYYVLNQNEGKSAAKLCHQVAAWCMGPRYVLQLLFSENGNHSAITEAKEKISAELESLEF